MALPVLGDVELGAVDKIPFEVALQLLREPLAVEHRVRRRSVRGTPRRPPVQGLRDEALLALALRNCAGYRLRGEQSCPIRAAATSSSAPLHSQSPTLGLTVESACSSQLTVRGTGNFRDARDARVQRFSVRPGDGPETRAPAAQGQPGPRERPPQKSHDRSRL